MPDFGNIQSTSKELQRQSRQSFAAAMQKEAAAEDRAAVAKAERNIAPERIMVRRCHTCMHPFRDWLELMMIKGMPYKTLSERVTPPVGRNSLSTHHKEHMDLEDTALRLILEREAQLQGIDFDQGVDDIITKKGVLEVALRKGYNDILSGVATVEPRDLVQIAKLLAEMESNQQQIGLDELRAQVQIFIQAIKDVCDPDTQQAIASRVKQLRGREGVQKKIENAMDEPVAEIPEATVVEEEPEEV